MHSTVHTPQAFVRTQVQHKILEDAYESIHSANLNADSRHKSLQTALDTQ